ncbi:LCP family protein [Luteococcus peritonei]|uniref:LCP family protein n=1 Tax=Luteococcus peritonei TaxID=88874 RepID=A0ABW4S131_9ACTN
MVTPRRARHVADDAPDGAPRHDAIDPLTSEPAVSSTYPEPAGAGASRGARRATREGHGFAGSVAWTLLGAVLPGSGLWPTRGRTPGVLISLLFAAAAAVVAALGLTDLGALAAVAVKPDELRLLGIGAIVLAVVLPLLLVTTHLATRPRPASPLQRAFGGLLVGLLSFLTATPLLVGANYARNQAGLVNSVFDDTVTRSQTRPTLAGRDPWKDHPRVNILLLGADSTAYRDAHQPEEGIRTDTVMLASIDTATGNMALVQLPRNLEAFTFPEGSPLAKAYPNGYWDGVDNENPEYELNSVWKNVPEAHPELFTDTDYPNGDAMKIAVEGITGIRPDYFAMLSIDGLTRFIDAVGGVTVNINTRLPIAQTSEEAAKGIPPKGGYLEVGPNQHLNGYKAMWYARSRSQSQDPDRMARQGCVVKAIVDQANPQTVLTRYEAIADAGKYALVTDIPQSAAPAMVDLALRMKDARVQRVLFGYPNTKYADGTQFKPWKPEKEKMVELIRAGIDKSMGTAPSPTAAPTSASAAPSTATPSSTPTPTPTPSQSPSAAAAQADLSDACAYHPQPEQAPR